ncbi:hypothetical protein [Candidatus Frankia alpina]|uniref:hypothetical protein n=1 Tax=Candidatus Frankia alpina TaxID=2699483 RepID=UPI0030135058
MLNAADIAMYAAKRAGPGQRIAYDRSLRTGLMDQLGHADAPRHAPNANDLATLQVTAVSTLLHGAL